MFLIWVYMVVAWLGLGCALAYFFCWKGWGRGERVRWGGGAIPIAGLLELMGFSDPYRWMFARSSQYIWYDVSRSHYIATRASCSSCEPCLTLSRCSVCWTTAMSSNKRPLMQWQLRRHAKQGTPWMNASKRVRHAIVPSETWLSP